MKVMKTIVGALLLLTSFSAFAETRVIKQAADWTLYETDGTTCYVSTSSYDPSNGDNGFPSQQSMVYLSDRKSVV